MTTINVITTEDDVRDLAIAIVDELVEQGLVQNCVDSEEEAEFAFQDVICDAIVKKLNTQYHS